MADRAFLESHRAVVALTDGMPVLLRPIEPADKEGLLEGFGRLSPQSRYRRFTGAVSKLTPELLAYLTEIDYVDHFAWLAVGISLAGEPGLGVARYVRLRDELDVAEAAVAVLDEFHGRGLGTLLLEALGAMALENGIRAFRAYVLADNTPMIDILHAMGTHFAVDGPGMLRGDIDLPEQMEKLKGSPLYATLRAVARGEITPRTGPELSRP